MSLRLWTAILGGLQVVTASANLADLVGDKWALWVILLVGAAQAGTAIYMRGASVPPDARAARAYAAYGESVGWRSVSGDRMPLWSELPPRIRQAWIAAGNIAAASR